MSLPDILNVKTMPTVENMRIDTQQLDPITISDSECVFQIPKNGILDGGSMVSLAVTTAAGVEDAYFPVKTGIYGLVKSAHLLVGSKEIASSEDVGFYETMVSQFSTPEHRAFVESVKSGRAMDRFVEVDEATGRLLPVDLEYTLFANDNSARAVVPKNLKPSPLDSTTPVFSVPLSNLIPMARSRQLPLFALKENVFLRLVFNTQSERTDRTICCFPSGSASSGVIKPSRVNIKFYSDHLYYSQPQMEALRSQVFSEQGLSYLYEDQIMTLAQVPDSANPGAGTVVTQSVERDIAVSGRTVRSLLDQEKFSTLGDNPGIDVLGQYVSNDMATETAYNFRINEQRVYDRDVTKPAHKFNELSQVFASPLQVPSQFYSFDVDANKDVAVPDRAVNQNSLYLGRIENHVLPTDANVGLGNDLRCTSHYIGIDMTTSGFNTLGNGKKVGNKPIVLSKTYKRTNGRNEAREIRVYASVERLMTIKNGDVMVSA